MLHVEIDALHTQGVRDQQLGVEACPFDAALGQPSGRALQDLEQR